MLLMQLYLSIIIPIFSFFELTSSICGERL